MTTKELLNNVELVNEMSEVWLELANLQMKLVDYCNNIQIDMMIKTSEDMIEKYEYLAVVVMEVYNKIPERRDGCEDMLLSIKEALDNLNKIKEIDYNIGD